LNEKKKKPGPGDYNPERYFRNNKIMNGTSSMISTV
jgi:hypothetical protein